MLFQYKQSKIIQRLVNVLRGHYNKRKYSIQDNFFKVEELKKLTDDHIVKVLDFIAEADPKLYEELCAITTIVTGMYKHNIYLNTSMPDTKEMTKVIQENLFVYLSRKYDLNEIRISREFTKLIMTLQNQ